MSNQSQKQRRAPKKKNPNRPGYVNGNYVGTNAPSQKQYNKALNQFQALVAASQQPPVVKRSRKQKQPQRGAGSNSGSSGVSATYGIPKILRNGAIFQDGFDSTFVRKCEFIQNVTGTALFTLIAALSINPGLATTFPWLSTIAQSWEKFRFRKLVFHYITRTGNNVPGTVLFAPDYDSSDATPVSEVIASDYVDADECPPYANPQTGHYMFPVNVARMNSVVKEHFVRTGALSANQDIKLYDPVVCNFFSIDGTAVAWGKIWVEYEVDLFTPQLPAGGVAGAGTLDAAGGTIAALTPFGAVPLALGSYNLAGAATNTMTFSGLSIGTEYQFSAVSTGTVFTLYGWVTPVGITLKTNNFSSFTAAATSAASVATYIATATSGSLTLAVTATTVTNTDVVVTALTPPPAF